MIPRPALRALAFTAVALASAPAHAQRTSLAITGDVERACAITASCGGNDRCSQLRLDDRINAQDLIELVVQCNFAGVGPALEVQSLNNGALRAAKDDQPLPYTVRMAGSGGLAFGEQRLDVRLRVAMQMEQPGVPARGMLRLRLEPRQDMLAADRYSDYITFSIVAAP